MVTSTHLLEEFSDVITRRRIARKYPQAAENAETLLDFLGTFAILNPKISELHPITPDHEDDFVLACALDEKVDCIVTSDPHLLNLKAYQGIPILTPRVFVLEI